MATQRLTLGEWLPDQPGLVNALSDAKNVVAQQVGYGPMKSAVAISQTAPDATLSSIYAAKDNTGETNLFVAGDYRVYSASGVGVLTDLSSQTGTYDQVSTTITVTVEAHRFKTGDVVYLNFTSGDAVDDEYTVTYVDADTFTVTATSATTSGDVTVTNKEDGYSATSRVRFTQFGSNILFTNNSQRLQSYVMGESSKFKNLSDDAPIAKYITVVRDFVVVANTYEEAEQKPYRVRWSDFNDETEWTYSDTTQSDFQDLPDGGQIMGIRGGEIGIVLMERGIYRMTYVGTPFIFQFDNISRGKGCVSSGSVAQFQGITFFLSDDGFYMCDGQQVTPIGAEKVDRWFFENVDEAALNDISAAVDPIKKTVVWNFKTNSGFYAQLVYNFKVAKWTYGDAQMDFISDASTPALTLEELDSISASIDGLPQSLDSVVYLGGRFFLGGTYNAKMYAFTGSNMTGVISSGDIDAGANSVITLARPQVDNGSGSVAVASRRLLSETPTFGTLVAADSENRVPLRSAGRYHRIKLTPTGDNWTTAIAVDYDLVGQGTR